MGKPVKMWEDGSVGIAVESGKDTMNRELRAGGPHVHVYKNRKRTDSRIPGRNKDLDANDYRAAEKLFDKHYKEIATLCKEVAEGKHDG